MVGAGGPCSRRIRRRLADEEVVGLRALLRLGERSSPLARGGSA
ncbi:protein TRANSPARENT TESTA GLABRA 1 [Iris pallida]|uniref:Protein TRANSPARENT TESTA GLABRA 1 n=1 Tax=Iris pallida TaxID=29817 RepID=A0AAX6G577_IRIPA|nr:protein TRANSPARENT TESTA GLABRA 1 [Iris pallida]